MADRGLIFVGPTGYQSPVLDAVSDQHLILPPLIRGELARVLHEHPAGRVVIVDGGFYHEYAVDHREICAAIDDGREVIGLGSMGALRAVELRSHGMRGFGAVVELVGRYGLDDDEVMLLHGAEPPYRPVTVPLVEVRAALGNLLLAGVVDAEEVAAVIAEVSSLWFADRSLPRILQAQSRRTHRRPEVAEALHHQLQGPALLKRMDLECLLTASPPPPVRLLPCGAVVADAPSAPGRT
ncbi:TfuA-like protein [Micromonospora sp. NPDC049060]|uniref:TfuA-like protein n=1 Tax=unclassified Micromonospora TaxID=2617518 RepID=UPI0033D6E5C0